MKKLLSCMTACLLAVQGLGGSVFAADAGNIKVGSGTAEPGKSFTLPVEITENPGITALSLTLTYDAEKLELLGTTDGGILGSSEFLSGKDLTKIPYTMNWDDVAETDNTGTGRVAELSFKAKDGASGSTEVKVAVNQKSTFNVALKEVAFTTESGTVTFSDTVSAVMTTAAPAVTTAAPAATTAAPAVTTAAPVVTTAAPVVTTAAPAATTAAPAATTAAPAATTAAPAATTAAPVVTTAAPAVTTAAPAITTAAPAITTAAPAVTTAAPAATTAAPAATTAAPVVTTAAPAVTTAAPAVTTAAPAVTTANAGSITPETVTGSPSIAADTVEAKAGEKVKVPVRMQNNPGILGLSLDLSYDNTGLKLLGAEDGKILGDSVFLAGNNLSLIPYTMNWDDDSAENNKGNGVLVTLEFEVLASGEHSVTLTLNQRSTFNAELKDVTFETVAGKIVAKDSIEVKEPVRGDVTLDGLVSVEDAQLALKAYTDSFAGKGTGMTKEQERNGDVTGDGVLSVEDAQYILMYYVKNTVSGTPVTWEELTGKKG